MNNLNYKRKIRSFIRRNKKLLIQWFIVGIIIGLFLIAGYIEMKDFKMRGIL